MPTILFFWSYDICHIFIEVPYSNDVNIQTYVINCAGIKLHIKTMQSFFMETINLKELCFHLFSFKGSKKSMVLYGG